MSATATERVVAELEAMFALPAVQQSQTPLQIVRTSYIEPTALLEAAGIPPVERDAFAEREWPADLYGIVPPASDSLGDEELGPLLLALGPGQDRGPALRHLSASGVMPGPPRWWARSHPAWTIAPAPDEPC